MVVLVVGQVEEEAGEVVGGEEVATEGEEMGKVEDQGGRQSLIA
jgi:hypothetical protein